MTRGECTVCAAAFEYDETKRGRRRKQCSRKCTNAAFRARKSAERQAERANSAKPCLQCGSAFQAPARGPVPSWCSTFCRELHQGRRRPALPQRECALAGCDVIFTPGRADVRCCSERHGQILWNRESRADGRQPLPVWNDRRRDAHHRRRALKAGSATERIDRAEIFDRDDWRCGICAEPVSPESVWPDPLSPSLDHILPLALGGAHVRANVQLAHLACNVRKGARVPV